MSGSERKKFQFTRSGSRRGGCGAMLMALRRVSCLFLAGQTSTHSRQPVQSSGATCRVYTWSLNSRQRAGADLKVAGAPAKRSGEYTLARMTLWGQTRTHLPHWMQTSVSHTGISRAMFRFYHLVVPVG